MAEVIQTQDCFIWRETAPATRAGYQELMQLLYEQMTQLSPNVWMIRAVPQIYEARDFDLDVPYYECRFRLASVRSCQRQTDTMESLDLWSDYGSSR